MAYITQLGGYVKFIRGTPTAWASLETKDSDTLYFISEANALSGKLYLGEKLISGSGDINITSLNELSDVILSEGIPTNSLLVYDSAQKAWVNRPLENVLQTLVSEMVGATADDNGVSGLVPTPKAGEQNLFLRGDATWANPTEELSEELAKFEESTTSQFATLLAGDTGSIRSIAADEVAKIVANAPEEFDTLKEIADWITNQGDVSDVVELSNRVGALEDTVNGTEETTGLVETVSDLNDIINGTDATQGLVAVVSDLRANYTKLDNSFTNLSNNYDSLSETVTSIDNRLKWQDLVSDE